VEVKRWLYFLFPVEVGRLTDLRLLAELRYRCPILALLDDERLDHGSAGTALRSGASVSLDPEHVLA
jgi:hypothetical protein